MTTTLLSPSSSHSISSSDTYLSSTAQLLTPSKVGVLLKLSKHLQTWRERPCFIDKTSLVYFASLPALQEFMTQMTSTPLGNIDLANSTVFVTDETQQQQALIEINQRTHKHFVHLSAPSPELADWLTNFSHAGATLKSATLPPHDGYVLGKHGWLQTKGIIGWNKRFYRTYDESSADTSNGTQLYGYTNMSAYTPMMRLPLSGAVLLMGGTKSFTICASGTQQTFKAESGRERDEWADVLNAIIEAAQSTKMGSTEAYRVTADINESKEHDHDDDNDDEEPSESTAASTIIHELDEPSESQNSVIVHNENEQTSLIISSQTYSHHHPYNIPEPTFIPHSEISFAIAKASQPHASLQEINRAFREEKTDEESDAFPRVLSSKHVEFASTSDYIVSDKPWTDEQGHTERFVRQTTHHQEFIDDEDDDNDEEDDAADMSTTQYHADDSNITDHLNTQALTAILSDGSNNHQLRVPSVDVEVNDTEWHNDVLSCQLGSRVYRLPHSSWGTVKRKILFLDFTPTAHAATSPSANSTATTPLASSSSSSIPTTNASQYTIRWIGRTKNRLATQLPLLSDMQLYLGQLHGQFVINNHHQYKHFNTQSLSLIQVDYHGKPILSKSLDVVFELAEDYERWVRVLSRIVVSSSNN